MGYYNASSCDLGCKKAITPALGLVPRRAVRVQGYFSYGETRHATGGLPTDYQFTGQRAEGFGLYDYHARFYDPYLGRFISADTLVPDPRPAETVTWVRAHCPETIVLLLTAHDVIAYLAAVRRAAQWSARWSSSIALPHTRS